MERIDTMNAPLQLNYVTASAKSLGDEAIADIKHQRAIKYTLIALGALAFLTAAAIPAAYGLEAEFLVDVSEDLLMLIAGVSLIAAMAIFYFAKKRDNESESEKKIIQSFNDRIAELTQDSNGTSGVQSQKPDLVNDPVIKKLAKYVTGPIEVSKDSPIIDLIKSGMLPNLRTLTIDFEHQIEDGVDLWTMLYHCPKILTLTLKNGHQNNLLLLSSGRKVIDLRLENFKATEGSSPVSFVRIKLDINALNHRMRILELIKCAEITMKDVNDHGLAGMNLRGLERFVLDLTEENKVVQDNNDITGLMPLGQCRELKCLHLGFTFKAGGFNGTQLRSILPRQRNATLHLEFDQVTVEVVNQLAPEPNRNITILQIVGPKDEGVEALLKEKFPNAFPKEAE